MYGVKCRDAVNDCDFPEYCSGESSDCPRNIYKQDGSNCTDAGHMGYCYQATCQTHESQCATLWGPGGTDAPEICYSRINIQGSQFGHCGQTGKDSYVACQPRQAYNDIT
jgi:disintegrin and metalloproteinase domain-containing protein 12